MPLEKIQSKKMKGEYHCPFPGCLYNGSEKSFSGKKFLNQHIAKVHAEKKFICEKCGKGFGLDWWRKHHEKTCGIEWICDCGSKYTSRESLLTHARRNAHELPDHVLHTNKAKQTKPFTASIEKPVILLIQPIPITQDITVFEHSALYPRPILPKNAEANTSNPMHNLEKQSSVSPVIKYESTMVPCDNSISNDAEHKAELSIKISEVTSLKPVNIISPIQKAVATQTFSATELPADTHPKESNLKQMQVSIATQTCNEVECLFKNRESRASQCSRRKSKALVAVRNESTHTQTAESAVVKIKRKRSRRKSVAITTEPCLLTLENPGAEQSVWPNFKDLILQNPEPPSFRNTMSTQTNFYMSKVLCDSQTITDKELFDWAEIIKKDYESDICKQPFELTNEVSEDPLATLQNCKQPFELTNEITDDALATLQDCKTPFMLNNELSEDPLATLQENNFCVEFDLFSAETIPKDNKLIKMRHNFTHMSSENTLENKTCPIFDMFSECSKPVTSDNVTHPVLSDIHTQTISNTELDFSLLANMETQTTDEFALYDLLEFSDTETQTPWDDFPDLDKSPLPPDQYSIEIQTDFSLIGTELNPDPYAFFNDTYVQNMIDACAEKERLSVNIETQTHDAFPFPQLTNSESQTLDISDLKF